MGLQLKRSMFLRLALTDPKQFLRPRFLPLWALGLSLCVYLLMPIPVRRHPVPFESPYDHAPFDQFLISSYYYPNSKSLGPNAVALVLTGHIHSVTIEQVVIMGWNQTANTMQMPRMQRITPHHVCKWVSYEIVTNTLPNMTQLAMVLGNRYEVIPFREPVYERHEVVTCIAPLFANEQWQYALFAAHTYKRFGTYMHLYVRSMVAPMFEMLKEYEKEGYLKIQPWMRINLKTVDEELFNPNVHIEFRNQAAAQTDCLLQYKESASYISFVDLDDILIPRLANNYLSEFNMMFAANPMAAYVHYSKENVAVRGHIASEDFSLAQMYSSIEFKQVNETGKFVTKPSLINSTWIHWPVWMPPGMRGHNVPHHMNAITHLKLMEPEMKLPSKEIRTPLFEPVAGMGNESHPLLTKEDIQWMQADLERMLAKPAIAAITTSHSFRFHYSGRHDKITCPGPDRCKFPENPGILCANSDGDYFSTSGNQRFNIHYVTNQHFRGSCKSPNGWCLYRQESGSFECDEQAICPRLLGKNQTNACTTTKGQNTICCCSHAFRECHDPWCYTLFTHKRDGGALHMEFGCQSRQLVKHDVFREQYRKFGNNTAWKRIEAQYHQPRSPSLDAAELARIRREMNVSKDRSLLKSVLFLLTVMLWD
ncbi:unnamed protein product, partial [Mesorhabditis spiculigera]